MAAGQGLVLGKDALPRVSRVSGRLPGSRGGRNISTL